MSQQNNGARGRSKDKGVSRNDSSISTREINKIGRVSPYRNITSLLDVMSP